MRPWKNTRGEGKLFNIELCDIQGTLIQATAFNDTAEKFYDMIEENQVYTFTGGSIKLANKRYTSIKNEYCLTFDYSTVVEKCRDDTRIKGDCFSFTMLEDVEKMVQ